MPKGTTKILQIWNVLKEIIKNMSITLKCGDCQDSKNWPTQKIDCLIGDPPFKPKKTGYKQIRDNTVKKMKEISTPSGEDWDEMMRSIFLQYNQNHSPSGYCIIKLDDYSARELYQRGSRFYSGESIIEYSYSIIWDKKRIGLGRKFRKQHEIIEIYLPQDAAHTFWFQKKAEKKGSWHGNSQAIAFSSIIKVANFNQGTLGVKNADHINQTPIDVWIPFLLHCVPDEALIFDPWMGSGSIGLAVKYVNKKYHKTLSYWGIEIDSDFFSIAKKNLLAETTTVLQMIEKRSCSNV